MKTLAKETKDVRFHPVIHPAFTCSYDGTTTGVAIFDILSGLAPGDEMFSEFEGQEINMYRLDLSFALQGSNPVAGPYACDTVRMIVWIEKEYHVLGPPTGSLIRQVLNTGSTSTPAIIHTPYNRSRTGQFRILKDKLITLAPFAQQAATNFVGTPNTRHFRMRLKIPKAWSRARWDTSAGYFSTNRIFVAFMSQQSGSSLPGTPSGYGSWISELIYHG